MVRNFNSKKKLQNNAKKTPTQQLLKYQFNQKEHWLVTTETESFIYKYIMVAILIKKVHNFKKQVPYPLKFECVMLLET